MGERVGEKGKREIENRERDVRVKDKGKERETG